MRFTTTFSCLLLALAGCQPAADQASAPPPAASPAAPQAVVHESGPEISAEDFAQYVKVLASDEFEGRAPGGRGEELTINYLKDQFQRLGLKPGNGDSYFQRVPMVETTADKATTLDLAYADGKESLQFGSEVVLGTSTGQADVRVADSELVFVGYGVNAPEAGWNDYSVDVKGKTVVVLVNDPGFHAGDAELFQGKRMTYYGRWTYKFEEAARQGAAAALIIHDDAGAGYGWEVVQNSWSGAQFDLPISEDPAPRLPIQGWITGAVAERLFTRTGLSLTELRAAANRPGFVPVAIPAKASSVLKSTIREAASNNVLALLPGSRRADEAVVYMGHWDHLGKNPELTGDPIFNGAIDNATGIAGILEIAEAFVTQEPAPERSVLFAAVTLEESGLLGSRYYVAHPTMPTANIVGVINLDAMQLPGKTRDLVVVGFGNSELEDILKPIADKQGRVLRAESAIEKGFYYRSDHFNFAKAGVPALYAKSGNDHLDKGVAYGEAWANDYTRQRYHQPGDEFDPAWDLSGVIQDLTALYQVGVVLADSEDWPNWYAGNEFKATRDAALQAKAAPATAAAAGNGD